MEDYEDALESLRALMKHFQWNLAGLIHYYDPEFTNMISEFDQDNVDICLEFQEKASYNGKHLAERIATSQSNVTLTIDPGYAAICYMQTAIERGEAAQITGKQIVTCCGETIFEMEDFNLKLWKNKHSETLPINKNPFDVYYWNITADGEMVLLKVDIDLGTGISRSYDPVDRSIQLSNGRFVTVSVG
ncbi:hypothetical protein NDU88_004258 [Pleurodeles waltl]|uniref:Receptor ligand binding region domain-containing protein n=1 Tax=Pleurodeles waltl TaxID=8319 RepID=A0AAV7L0I1_PLEWA|nr:hypothetical protein NDU88_004258 [Pleurodeles waltl]